MSPRLPWHTQRLLHSRSARNGPQHCLDCHLLSFSAVEDTLLSCCPKQHPLIVQGFLNTERSIRAFGTKKGHVSFYHPQDQFFSFQKWSIKLLWQNLPKNQGILFHPQHSGCCCPLCQLPSPCSSYFVQGLKSETQWDKCTDLDCPSLTGQLFTGGKCFLK